MFHAGEAEITLSERQELEELRARFQQISQPLRKSASEREKTLRNLVRVPTLRLFDAELADVSSKLFKKKLKKGEPGCDTSSSAYTKRRFLWVELFKLAARPALQQIVKDHQVNDWSNLNDITEAMLWIARERRKNHQQNIKEFGEPKDLLYQSPFAEPLDLPTLIEQLQRNSKAKKRHFFAPMTPVRKSPMRRLTSIKKLHRKRKLSPSSLLKKLPLEFPARRKLTPELAKTIRPKSEPDSFVRRSVAIPKRKRLRRPAEQPSNPRKRLCKPSVPSPQPRVKRQPVPPPRVKREPVPPPRVKRELVPPPRVKRELLPPPRAKHKERCRRGGYDPTPGFCDAPTLADLEECQVRHHIT